LFFVLCNYFVACGIISLLFSYITYSGILAVYAK